MLLLIIILAVFALLTLGAGLTYSRFGYAGFSPAVLVLIVLLILYLTGHIRIH